MSDKFEKVLLGKREGVCPLCGEFKTLLVLRSLKEPVCVECEDILALMLMACLESKSRDELPLHLATSTTRRIDGTARI